MALYMYRYFQTVDALPDTSGPLSASLSPAAIKDVNEAVRSATRVTKPRGKNMPYLRPSSRQRVEQLPHCTATRQLSVVFQSSWGKQRKRNLKIRNFILKATRSFMRKFAPTKISRYTVYACPVLLSLLCHYTLTHMACLYDTNRVNHAKAYTDGQNTVM